VLSFDTARRMWQAGDLADRWDVMIVDECHFAKNPQAQRTKMVYGKEGLGHQVGAIWSLSGTPAPKHAGELWPMLRAFGAVQMSYDDFLDRYCVRWWHKQRREWVIKGTREDRIPELQELLAPIMLRRTRKEVAPELPGIDFQFLEVAPTGVDLIVPKGFEGDALVEWVKACTPAEDRQAVAHAKVAPLVEEITFAIENDLLKQTVAFGWHKEPLQTLAWKLNQRGIHCETITGDTSPKKREKVQTDFREGKTQVIAANILAAGTAIDLSAASHAYMVELDWVPGNNMQAVNRLVSLQKQEPVSVDVVTWPGSVDDRVQRVLTRRVKEINQLI
jgi:superfamily II DNA or RNA helicase